MINIRDKAKEKIEELRTNAELSDDYCIRVGVVCGGCTG